MNKHVAWLLAATLLAVSPALAAAGPQAARLEGAVLDETGAAIVGARVTVEPRPTGVPREHATAANGRFRIEPLPPREYVLRVEAAGFRREVRRVDVRTEVPGDVTITLRLAPQVTSVIVSAGAGPEAARTASGTIATIGREQIDRLPVASGSRGLEAILVTLPGFAQNANGAIHPRGAHNQMTYVIDGLPISDQLTGAFANALDPALVDDVQMLTGNIPAEFGGKVSGVAVVTSRSGLALTGRSRGEATVSAAGFDTRQVQVGTGGHPGAVGYFASVSALDTDRFLDQVSRENLHNAGGYGRVFARVDLPLGGSGLLRANAMGGRSAFELANLRSQQAHGQDQRQRLADAAGWASYLRPSGAGRTFDITGGYRAAGARLLPSAGDTPVTARQRRSLGTVTVAARYGHVAGRHTWRLGTDYQRVGIRERFTFGITSPAFNDAAAPRFNPALRPFDLSRGGAPFAFDARGAGRMLSAFAEDRARWKNVTVALGLRVDDYRLLVHGWQLQPRVGIAWALPRGAVLRASFNRNYQTPPNENLLLSSSEAASALAPASVRDALGGAWVPIRPERQDVYEVGWQQGLGGGVRLDVSAYRKRSRDQQDNNNFFDTGIIFPVTLAAIRAAGAEARLTTGRWRGISGTLSATSSHAVSSPPFTGGLFLGQDAVDLLAAGPFVIDHDQRLSVHGTSRVAWRRLWAGLSVRYDSGLVANPSDPEIVARDPDYADLLPYVTLAADVPRVRPRTIADIAVGLDPGRRRRVDVQLQVTNLTNRVALYNFQSVFVGTRLVAPRTAGVRVRWRW